LLFATEPREPGGQDKGMFSGGMIYELPCWSKVNLTQCPVSENGQ